MNKEEAIKILKENSCSICSYCAKNMESCDIRYCDNREAIRTLEKEIKESKDIHLPLYKVGDRIEPGTDGYAYKMTISNGKEFEQQPCKDAVSREELKKWLDMNFSFGGALKKLELFDRLDKELPSVTPITSWIPVSERMPNPGEYNGNVDRHYLVQNEYDDMLVARYTKKECWEQIFQIGEIKEKIVAWQPLPKPYKAEMESEE